MKKGIIFVDGVDGSGKSTFCQRLQSFIHAIDGGDVDTVSFPTAEVKTRLKASSSVPKASDFLADIGSVLLTQLASPNWLICDRSFLSTMAYQGVSLAEVTNFLPGAVLEVPMAIIWLDWPVETILQNLGVRTAGGGLGGIGILDRTSDLKNQVEKLIYQYDLSWTEWASACRMKATKKAVRVSMRTDETFDKAIDRFIRDDMFSLIRSLGVTI